MTPWQQPWTWIVIGFLSGSVPYALLIGRLAAGEDIRRMGDGNPGAFNVLKAGGALPFVIAALADAFKAAIPVGLAYFLFGIDGWWLVPVGAAPLLGHIYSPWLKFKGGKAVASTFGVWSGLTIWEGPTIIGLLLGLFFSTVAVSGWAVVLMMLAWLAYLLLTGRTELPWLALWGVNAGLLALRYRDDLRQPLAFRGWFTRLADRLLNVFKSA